MEREQPVKGDTYTEGGLPMSGDGARDGKSAVNGKPSADGKTAANGKPSADGKTAANGKLPADRKSGKPRKDRTDGKSVLMKRNAAREIAVHLAYELSFTDRTVEALLAERLTADAFASLSEEDSLYAVPPDDLQIRYITRLVSGVSAHGAELDGYIEKYAVGWKFARIPLMASAIMRTAMYEMLYMPEIPNAAAVNSAVDIAKKYETPETVRFINGILGSFSRQELS